MNTITKWFTSLALIAAMPAMITSAEASPGKQGSQMPLQLAATASSNLEPLNIHTSGCSCASCQQAQKTVDQSTV